MNKPLLQHVYFVKENYSMNHPHMLHKHANHLELLYVESGKGRYCVGKREYMVGEGDLIICNAGILHGEAPYQKEHNIQTYCCSFSNIKLDLLPYNHLVEEHVKPVIHMEEIQEHVRNIMKTIFFVSKKKNYNPEIKQYLGESLFLLVEEKIREYRKSAISTENQKNEFLIRDISEYLDKKFTENLTLKEISDAFYISPSSLSHIFKRETGLSPMQYLIHRRIGEAQSMLVETKVPIKEIEETLGFTSSSHFSSLFKKYVGISPKQYRDSISNH